MHKIKKIFEKEYNHIWPQTCPEEHPPECYLVYTSRSSPRRFCDNKDKDWFAEAYIHLYKKGNYLKDKENIKKILKENKIICSEIEELYEAKTGYYHIVFSFEMKED